MVLQLEFTAWRLVKVIKAGEREDENSRVCHAVLNIRKDGCSKQSRLQPPPQTLTLSCELIKMHSQDPVVKEYE